MLDFIITDKMILIILIIATILVKMFTWSKLKEIDGMTEVTIVDDKVKSNPIVNTDGEKKKN